MSGELSLEDIVVRKIGDKTRLRREKDLELLTQVHRNAIALEQAEKSLRKGLAK